MVSRNAEIGERPESVIHWNVEAIGSLRTPSCAPSNVVDPIAARTSASDPAGSAQVVVPARNGRRPIRPSRASKIERLANIPKYWEKASPRSIQRSTPNSAIATNV